MRERFTIERSAGVAAGVLGTSLDPESVHVVVFVHPLLVYVLVVVQFSPLEFVVDCVVVSV